MICADSNRRTFLELLLSGPFFSEVNETRALGPARGHLCLPAGRRETSTWMRGGRKPFTHLGGCAEKTACRHGE